MKPISLWVFLFENSKNFKTVGVEFPIEHGVDVSLKLLCQEGYSGFPPRVYFYFYIVTPER